MKSKHVTIKFIRCNRIDRFVDLPESGSKFQTAGVRSRLKNPLTSLDVRSDETTPCPISFEVDGTISVVEQARPGSVLRRQLPGKSLSVLDNQLNT